MLLIKHNDPGHGWLGVPIRLLDDLRIRDKISEFSYHRNGTAYLEEDCDYTTFDEAMAAAGRKFEVVEEHTNNDHPIRGYARFPITQ